MMINRLKFLSSESLNFIRGSRELIVFQCSKTLIFQQCIKDCITYLNFRLFKPRKYNKLVVVLLRNNVEYLFMNMQ